jgi:predicted negative regulator of RcsB-dependent stress response
VARQAAVCSKLDSVRAGLLVGAYAGGVPRGCWFWTPMRLDTDGLRCGIERRVEGTTSGLFEDLRRVGALKRMRLGGEPSDRALARVASVSRTTVGVWLRGEQLPQRIDPLLAVLGEIRAEAHRRALLHAPVDGGTEETVADLLADDRWRSMFRAERERRTQTDRRAAEREQARAALQREERLGRLAALADRPRPVRSWPPRRLGVHPAITGRRSVSDGQDDGGFVLPVHVARAHDDRMCTLLTTAATDGAQPLLVAVRGASCTGKTRTAYEAVRAVVPDWDLWAPVDASGLLAMLSADALGPRTVLWLDEAQTYLMDGAAGEAAAVALLRRLDQSGPLLVLATLWPDYDTPLKTRPDPAQADPHRHARTLLAQAAHVDVPSSFADDLDAVRAAADHDASLAAVVEAGTIQVTQTLAAGPDLVERYEYPVGKHGVYGQALISVAMDAHRLGANSPLPVGFLQAAASGYFTDDQRAAASDSWFNGALAYARTKVKQITAPLQDVPRPSGMGAQPGVVRLADYLQQHARHTRSTICPPATFWEACVEYLTNSDDIRSLGYEAYRRLRYFCAIPLLRTAADNGDSDAAIPLAEILERQGRVDEAIDALRDHLDNTFSAHYLAELLVAQDKIDEAVEVLKARTAYPDGPGRTAAEWMFLRGEVEQAIKSLRRRFTRRSYTTCWVLEQDVDELRARADSGNAAGIDMLAQCLAEQGKASEAIDALRDHHARFGIQVPATGNRLAELLAGQGRFDEAIAALQTHTEAGCDMGTSHICKLLDVQGKRDEADRLRRFGLTADGKIASNPNRLN